MTTFSQRYGYSPVRSVLQTGAIDEGLRNRLWNLVRSTFFNNVPPWSGAPGDFFPHTSNHEFFKNLWHNYLKRTVETIGNSYFDAVNDLKKYVMECPWHEVYDFIEFLAQPRSPVQYGFINSVNEILKQESGGYRFVSGQIVEITSEEEIKTIEQALSLPDSLKPVREHLNQSLKHLSNREDPDYRNSIKESISAVESMSKIISNHDKATLTAALNAVERKTNLHSDLKHAFQKLYGYTNDSEGIRHALMEEQTLDTEDAKFMLVSCSAFVNYLVVKAQKAGIKI